MNAPTEPKRMHPANRTTTVFTSGNSQAVRLPKEFRLNSKTVEIFRSGSDIVLREASRSFGKKLADLMADLPPLTDKEAADLDAALTSARDTRLPQERDFSWAENQTGAKNTGPRRRKS